MHTPYETILKHGADFKVSYRFYTAEEGGRRNLPYQGIRSDFSYAESDKEKQAFMVWPEFLDKNGELILDNGIAVPETGIALMWVIITEMRPYHLNKIRVGQLCYFTEGIRRTAECTVVEILDLAINPILSTRK